MGMGMGKETYEKRGSTQTQLRPDPSKGIRFLSIPGKRNLSSDVDVDFSSLISSLISSFFAASLTRGSRTLTDPSHVSVSPQVPVLLTRLHSR